MAANEITILFLCDHQALGLLFRKGVDYRIEQIGRGDGNENSYWRSSSCYKLCKANKCLYVIRCLRKEGCSQAEVDHLFSSIVLPNITYVLSVYGASESELTIAQQFLDRCFKRRYISKKLEIGELLKVQDHRICRKVSSIPNHPLRANFPETKITRYNLRNKSSAMPAIHTDRFKNTFFNRIVFKYNVAL